MKKIRIFAVLALSVFAVACAKETEQEPQEQGNQEQELLLGPNTVVFTAELTKTAIDANDEVATWVAGDEVKFVWAGGSDTAAAASSGASTTFTVEIPDGIDELYAIYPASAAGSYNGGKVTVHYSGAREDGSFAANDICVAKAVKTGGAWNTSLAFKNAACLFKVGVTSSDIVKIRIEAVGGEEISGAFEVSLDGSGNPVVGDAVGTAGTMSRMDVSGPGVYYIPVKPGVTLSQGFRISRFTGESDQVVPFYYNGVFTTERGKIVKMNDVDAHAGQFYVTPTGAGSKGGQSWSNAMGVDEFKTLVTNVENYFILQGATIHFSADEFSFGDDYLVTDFSGHGTVNLTFEGTINGANRTTFLGRTNTSDSNKAGVLWPKTSTNLTVKNVKFTGTNGKSNSAAIRVNSTGVVINLDNCIFQGNQTLDQSACINMIKGTANVTNCEFTGNIAGKGASLHIENATANVSHCTFTNNTGDGGFLHCSNTAAVVEVEDCDVSGGNRCAIYNENSNSVSLTRVKIHDVHADNESGAAGWLEGAGTYTFTDCEFVDNCADWRGGAIAIASGNIHASFTGGKFEGNHADGESHTSSAGAAIYAYGENVCFDCNNVLFKSNYNNVGSDQYSGGVIRVEQNGGIARLNGCVFDGNYSYRSSSNNPSCAAIVNSRTSEPIYYFNACEFKNNASGTYAGTGAKYGMLMATYTACTIAMNNCSIHDNYGGRSTDPIDWIYIDNTDATLLISNSSVIGDPMRKTSAGGSASVKNTNGVIYLSSDGNFYFINNVLCSPTGKSLNCATSITIENSYYNKTSPVNGTCNWGTDTGSGHDYYATTASFGNWTMPYTWNGTLTGTNSNMLAATADVNTEIQNADANFYAWLNSIGALGKDINGNNRGTTSWPGCYQN